MLKISLRSSHQIIDSRTDELPKLTSVTVYYNSDTCETKVRSDLSQVADTFIL